MPSPVNMALISMLPKRDFPFCFLGWDEYFHSSEEATQGSLISTKCLNGIAHNGYFFEQKFKVWGLIRCAYYMKQDRLCFWLSTASIMIYKCKTDPGNCMYGPSLVSLQLKPLSN